MNYKLVVHLLELLRTKHWGWGMAQREPPLEQTECYNI